jgi:hypothetical protein
MEQVRHSQLSPHLALAQILPLLQLAQILEAGPALQAHKVQPWEEIAWHRIEVGLLDDFLI